MFFVRPIARADLPVVLALSERTGTGLTTLPADRDRLHITVFDPIPDRRPGTGLAVPPGYSPGAGQAAGLSKVAGHVYIIPIYGQVIHKCTK
jgi:hypothetical protein